MNNFSIIKYAMRTFRGDGRLDGEKVQSAHNFSNDNTGWAFVPFIF